MCAHRIYTDFNQVEKEIREKAPKSIYKYRTWTNDFHKRFLTHREAWFAHPFTLNDPQDIRRPYEIDITGHNSEEMFNKLYYASLMQFPYIGLLERAQEIGFRWQKIQKNPKDYFRKNIETLYNDYEFYARIGVFSTCNNGLSFEMWESEEYSNTHKGYCMGFNTVELARSIQCLISKVVYSDEEFVVNAFEGFTDRHMMDDALTKYTKWQHEDEFRFIMHGIQNENRTRIFSEISVDEILIGKDATNETLEEIISATRNTYGNRVQIFKTELFADRSLRKVLIEV